MDQSIIDSFAEVKPLREEETPGVSPAQPAEADAPATLVPPGKPWLRFVARSFDILLFSVIAETIARIAWPDIQAESFLLIGLTPGMLLYLLTDAVLMKVFGATPGKYLLKIHVVPTHLGNMTLAQSLRRSFSVGWHGLAFGLPLANVVTLYGARKRLLEKGKTHWDEKGHFYVLHQEVGIFGPVVLAFLSIILLLLGLLLASLSGARRHEQLPEYQSRDDTPPKLPAADRALANPMPLALMDTGNRTSDQAAPAPARTTPPALAQKTEEHNDMTGRQAASAIAAMEQADLNRPVTNTDALHAKAHAGHTRPMAPAHKAVMAHAYKAPVITQRRSEAGKEPVRREAQSDKAQVHKAARSDNAASAAPRPTAARLRHAATPAEPTAGAETQPGPANAAGEAARRPQAPQIASPAQRSVTAQYPSIRTGRFASDGGDATIGRFVAARRIIAKS